jgi:hypothetical protein
VIHLDHDNDLDLRMTTTQPDHNDNQNGCYGAVLLAACLWAAIATSGWVICWLTK